MEIGRRGFIAAVLGFLVDRILPRPVVEGMQCCRYPGPVRELDEEEVRKVGPWAG
jgi:hypothetical protein